MTSLSDLRSWPATALRFARTTEPRATLTRRAVALDALLALAAATASLAIAMAGAGRGGPDAALNPVTPAVLASVLATTAPLAMRRVFPVAVFWLILGAIVADTQTANFISYVAFMLAAYSAVVHSRFRGAALISVPLAAVMVTAVYPDTSIPQPGRFTALFMLIPVVLVGSAVHRWRHQAGHSQEQLQRAEAEHAAATTRALAAERSRIAGELHDVVTHNVSVMVVQAGAARRILSASPEDARAALLAVEASGRTAMVELQHMLGLLAPVEGMQPQRGSARPDPALLHPQPGLSELPALVDRVAAAGLRVELTVTGQARQLPAGLDLTAYRIVQEAITNVMKHAGPTVAVVALGYHADGLVIDVADDGGPRQQPGHEAGHEAGQVGARSGPMAGSGRGLLGLRERVSLYGGEFDARPRPGGGWRVIAQLPDSTPGCVGPGAATAAIKQPTSVPARS